MKHIIAVLNQKGGVGKTTTAINVAAYLAMDGKKVLLVDDDPQGNSTSGLGIDKNSLDATLYDVLFSRVEATKVVQKTAIKGLYVLPANAKLAGAEVELVNTDERELQLRRVVRDLDYEYILIDCPPSLSLLTVNALAAADDVLIPVQAEYYALEGLSQLLEVIHHVKQALNPSLNVLGLVVTLYDKRNSLAEQVRADLKKHFGVKLFDTVVPRNVRLAEAPSFGRTIIEHDRASKGAIAYQELAKELEAKL